jgi:AbrB family looped-hinge helix DNA binding protein
MKECNKTIRIDELGRVYIPVSIRRKLDIDMGDKVDIYLEDNTIKIVKTDTSFLDHYIHNIKDVASDSRYITNKEYEALCEILGKLGGKVNE